MTLAGIHLILASSGVASVSIILLISSVLSSSVRSSLAQHASASGQKSDSGKSNKEPDPPLLIPRRGSAGSVRLEGSSGVAAQALSSGRALSAVGWAVNTEAVLDVEPGVASSAGVEGFAGLAVRGASGTNSVDGGECGRTGGLAGVLVEEVSALALAASVSVFAGQTVGLTRLALLGGLIQEGGTRGTLGTFSLVVALVAAGWAGFAGVVLEGEFGGALGTLGG